MATITPIEGRSVHQIQSGQVIVDLCSVVKELVENSLDAGATSIDVRFKNNGLESIEVQDNGHGIAPADYDTIALKHYTSKLSSYSDLNSLRTFGFRGEALSSLCALSHFHILTARASDGAKGTRLDFELSGKLKGTSVVASQRGTTVVVENLFHNLPVRRKELEKNIKREYGKVLGLLHAYACISSGVRFAVSNQAAKGKKVVVFSTKANPSTRENIANVYGAKTLMALIPLDLTLEMAPASFGTQTARIWSTQEDVGTREVKIVGHISRPVVGEGRQTPDRQMFFVNSRPCALPQVSKAINDVYKGYNVTQSPFIFANLVMDTGAYDVNVSPDKRTILLHDQNALLEALKEALVRCFEEHDQSVPQAQVGKKQLSQFRPLNFAKSTPAPRDEEKEKEDSEPPSSSPPEPNGTPVSLMQKFASRDVMSRSRVPAPAQRRSEPAGKEKPKATEAAEKGKPRAETEPGDSRALSKSMELDSSSPAPAPISPLSRPVQDFNARIGFDIAAKSAPPQSSDEKEEQVVKPPESPGENNPAAVSSAEHHQESATQSSAKGPIQNAFDRMRPKRAPAETATITIGDKTTTMTIGTPAQPNKKRRIHTPKYGLDGKLLDQSGKKESGKLGGFVSALKMFRAPGTQAGESSEAEDETDDDEPVRKRGGSEGAEEEDDGSDPRTEALEDADGDDKSVAPGSIAEESDDEADAARDSEKEASAPPPRQGSPLFVQNDQGDDDEYLDEETKKEREEARVAEMIAKAEETAAKPSKNNIKRATSILKGRTSKQSTLQLVQTLDTSVDKIGRIASSLAQRLKECQEADGKAVDVANADQSPEERLSLTVTKADFSRMRIIGQFNLGFIIAVRPATCTDGSPAATPTASGGSPSASDDLFIIDQHASDEKINFERLSATYILTPQRLVHPLPLSLTAIEEETILSNPAPFAANGFLLETDTSGEQPVGQRCRLLGVPVAKEMGLVKGAGREEVFGIKDLEELIVLVGEMGGTSTTSQADDERHGESQSNSETKKMNRRIPRPAKVRKSLAMRACRSSIMIGRYLTLRQMRKVVDSMGEIDKPWNCPHGRPTMRHLAGLAEWSAWQEGEGVVGAGVGVERLPRSVSWGKFLKGDRSGTGV
ncbi:DNA mismatch repair protein-like protein pms1 [Phyllosticta citribraziliensis]|uniref:DNA mismatch repair protein-like protein pms1 n=1 Tax=Phyllosticta citribraziliensis TaxID=989973 RepID=A0ABR1LZR7_9PEZI